MGSSLQGKVIWVVGAGSGVGEACAALLARDGARLALSGRRAEAIERVAASLSADDPTSRNEALILPGDMSSEAAVAAAVEAIVSRFGALDVLINCAGANIPERDLRSLSPGSLSDVMDGNLKAAFLLSLAVLPIMRAQAAGTIIHISSWAARHFSPASGSAYTATKQGVVALCHAINMEEGGCGIRATAICPAEVNTDFLERRPNPPDASQRAAMLQPADIAEAVQFVLDRRSSVCINELIVSGAVGAASSRQPLSTTEPK